MICLDRYEAGTEPTARVQEIQGNLVLHMFGEIDSYIAETVMIREFSSVASRFDKNWIIDLSGASYIDSDCLAKILKMCFELREKGKRMVVVSNEGLVSRAIDFSEEYRIQNRKRYDGLLRFISIELAVNHLNV